MLVVEMAWSTGAATPNYHPVAHGASRTHYSKGYRAITCRYIQMTEQLRLLYQLRGNCSHSTERLALYKAQSSHQKGGFKCDLPASSNQLPRLLRSKCLGVSMKTLRGPEAGDRQTEDSRDIPGVPGIICTPPLRGIL